MHFVNNH